MREGLAVERYDRLITSIYEAAYDWSKWPAFMEVCRSLSMGSTWPCKATI